MSSGRDYQGKLNTLGDADLRSWAPLFISGDYMVQKWAEYLLKNGNPRLSGWDKLQEVFIAAGEALDECE